MFVLFTFYGLAIISMVENKTYLLVKHQDNGSKYFELLEDNFFICILLWLDTFNCQTINDNLFISVIPETDGLQAQSISENPVSNAVSNQPANKARPKARSFFGHTGGWNIGEFDEDKKDQQ